MIIYFHSIIGIYPLTEEAERLLHGKINQNIRVKAPLFASAVETTKAIRVLRNQELAARRLLNIFEVRRFQSSLFIEELGKVVENFAHRKENANDNFLYQLLSYNKTPGYVPSGNVEYLIKIGLVTLLRIGINDDARNSKFVTKFSEYKNDINQGSLFAGFENFILLLNDTELKASFEKICDNIGLIMPEVNLFEIAYFYIAIKSHLHKHEGNLLTIADELFQVARKKPRTFAQVLLLIGHSFSFERLYESIHALEQAPILKEVKILNRIVTVDIEVEESRETADVEVIQSDLKKDTGKKSSKRSSQGHMVSNEQVKIEDDLAITDSSMKNVDTLSSEPNDEMSEKGSKSDPELDLGIERLGSHNDEKETDFPKQAYSVIQFSNWIQIHKSLIKFKKEAWGQFIRYHFEDQGAEFSFENLKSILKSHPESESQLLTKSGKGKFDLESIRTFFGP